MFFSGLVIVAQYSLPSNPRTETYGQATPSCPSPMRKRKKRVRIHVHAFFSWHSTNHDYDKLVFWHAGLPHNTQRSECLHCKPSAHICTSEKRTDWSTLFPIFSVVLTPHNVVLLWSGVEKLFRAGHILFRKTALVYNSLAFVKFRHTRRNSLLLTLPMTRGLKGKQVEFNGQNA